MEATLGNGTSTQLEPSLQGQHRHVTFSHLASHIMADLKSSFEALCPAYLEVHLPRAQDFDAAAVLRSGTPEELVRTPGRRNLFFGIALTLSLETPAD